MKNSRIAVWSTAAGLTALLCACNPSVGGNRTNIKVPLSEPSPQETATANNALASAPNFVDNTRTPLSAVPDKTLTPSNEDQRVAVNTETFVVPKQTTVNFVPYTGTSSKGLTHTIAKGESLSVVAAYYGVSTGELAACNAIELNKKLSVGSVLTIPPGGKLCSAAKQAEILKRAHANAAAKAKPVTTPTTAVTPSTPPSTPATPSNTTASVGPGGTHTVASGDNPWTIARKYKVKLKDLLAANGLNEKSVLQVGQVLKIPGGSGSVTPAVTEPSGVTPVVGTPDTTAPVTPAPTPGTVTQPSPIPVESEPIIAVENETLRSLSTMFGISLDDLMKANPGIDPDQKLKSGTRLNNPAP